MKKYGILFLAVVVAIAIGSVDGNTSSYASDPTPTPIASATLRSTPSSSLTPQTAIPHPTEVVLSATQWASYVTPPASTATTFPDF